MKAARAKIEKPWGGGAGVGVSRCFDANNSAYAYEPGAWAEPEKPKRKEEDPDAPKPFKPPSTHGRGAPEVFAHVSDPTDYDGERRRAARAASRKAGRFYPPKGAKSTPTSTIGKYDRGTWTAPSSLERDAAHQIDDTRTTSCGAAERDPGATKKSRHGASSPKRLQLFFVREHHDHLGVQSQNSFTSSNRYFHLGDVSW